MNKIASLIFLIVLSSCGSSKEITTVKHANLPTPIGPYSHSTSYGDLIFISGQIGIDPKSNTMRAGIQEQTLQIFENLKAILQDNHSDLDHITKTTIFISDMKQFDVVNKIYGSYFKNHFPARSTIEVVSLPRNAVIEIECIAVKK
ncbi:Rid family detoxifying hydrolase [Pedobacter alluvionis]|uniref:2-iminobutanoate/2-iminopropanoate deaminase n=1 Tax=Pedobacter alluvionis TaxID=475253 RepID=A0A497YBC7_9SPHI|nr:Rid family detoxifying hydrolase [Pedobacter alluvionis]RLJ80986.1 2-iminobutanoate/2-iminopropanoate deaminase [Pedobacter alluvionis]TFB27901.1 reactive intermediate/imine deaminase [Pedobacter alluvionis]